ncbi:hypothetical protein BD626DRAFT_520968 [Schizophyllum amplum]|uniref:DUF6533 domain-containing protein n=1 Tax=Schizophyllum amplum TaxID=97359 RepID=A0A550BU60_9AGAR|nr:hypothetical protein BD626DRAFT_520968 [Auriculariopsis ampla]
MASDSPQAEKQYQHFVQYCLQWSSITLLYYDFSLTFASERKLIWERKFGVTTLLFVLCPYALVANVVYLLAISHKIVDCDSAYQSISALSVLGRTAVLSTWATRTWAVWGRNIYIITFLGLLVCACTALDCYQASGAQCTGPATHQEVSDVLSIMVVVFEFSSTALTMYRCIPAMREQRRMETPITSQQTLGVAIFQQGLMYYCAVSLFTVTALILNYVTAEGFFQRLLNAFTLPISGILTARFILHLRSIAGQDVVSSQRATGDATQLSRLSFTGDVSRTAADEQDIVSQTDSVAMAGLRDQAVMDDGSLPADDEDISEAPLRPTSAHWKGKKRQSFTPEEV